MRLFLTNENQVIIKKHYLKKLDREYEIINLSYEIAENDCYDFEKNKYEKYILNQAIKNKFEKYNKNKRVNSLIYIVDKIDFDFITNLKDFLDENNLFFNEIVLIDYSMDVDRKLYKHFDDVM